MNRKMVLGTVGRITMLEAVLLLLPAAVAVYYNEINSLKALLISIGVSLLAGVLLTLFCRTRNRNIFAKEGFVTVALSWILLSVIGALPFYISGEIPSYIDALFETVSGFTTTGASILTDVESMSQSLLFWRSFTHWIGGMGVLVFIMALIPNMSDRPIHMMRAEMPGPMFGKLVPRAKDTAKILYLIYIALTALEVVLLIAGGMPLFDSVVHSFGTAGTGGFGIKSDSLASYSPYLQWVITIFMFVFGLNFNLFYLILIRRARSIIKSAELWTYIGIIVVSVSIITLNIYPLVRNVSDSLRLSSFQLASVISTTGYSTANFDAWPELSKTVLLIVMFIGGCAGSTAGGFKVSRIVLLFKMARREAKRMIHPRSVGVIKFEDKQVDEGTLTGVGAYLTIYIMVFFVLFLLLSFEPFDFTTNFSATVACINNIGPGFGKVGPMESYAGYSDFSKVLLSFAMMLGRLEIFPILILFSPSTWSKN